MTGSIPEFRVMVAGPPIPPHAEKDRAHQARKADQDPAHQQQRLLQVLHPAGHQLAPMAQ